MQLKQCRDCGIGKPLDAFSPSATGTYGRRSECRSCGAIRQRERRAANPERAAAQDRRDVEARRRRHAEGIRSPAHALKPRRTPEPGSPEWEQRRRWANRVKTVRWYAKQLGAQVNDLRLRDWLALLDEHGGRCAYCGIDGDMWLEHVIPLARGGDNTKANVVPACEPCNRRKARRTADEFGADECQNGHPQNPENTYIYPDGRKRACRICTRASLQRYRSRRKVATM